MLNVFFSKTTVGTELSAHSHLSSKYCPLSQVLLLGIGADSGNLDGSFEFSVMELSDQHTCRQNVPFVFVIVQSGGSNVCTLTTA